MNKINPSCVRTPSNPVLKGYVPEGGIRHRVADKESWVSLARELGLDPWVLIRFNYPTLPADERLAALEVNWYLQEYVGCKDVTADSRNYIFSGSADPGIIYLPPGMNSSIHHSVAGRSQAKESLCWYASLQMVVEYYRRLGRGHGVKDPSEDPETRQMYAEDKGVSDRERIARKLGFSVRYESLTEPAIWEMLKQGPLIYAGAWPGQLSGHWVVINGISGGAVSVLDPWYGPRTFDYKDFVSKVLIQTAERPLIYVP